MRNNLVAISTMMFALACARTAQAQGGNSQFYGGVGAAYGTYDLIASGIRGAPGAYDFSSPGSGLPATFKNNVAVYGEFGVHLNHHVALGVEADYYTKGSGGTTFKVWYYNFAAAFYPFREQLWIKVLAGYSTTTGDVMLSGGGYGSPSQGGPDMGLGLGYDIRFGHEGKFALVPFAQYLSQLVAGTPWNAPFGTSYRSDLFMMGAALAFVH